MKRKSKKGVGITILNNRMYSRGWRPLLPVEVERSFPSLCKLIKKCWAQKREDRPSFDEIVRALGEVKDEVRTKEEPSIELYSMEDDAVYRDRMGMAEEVFDEEDGRNTVKFDGEARGNHEKVLKELRAKLREKEKENESLRAQMEQAVGAE